MKICISLNFYFKINFKECMFSSSRAISTPTRSIIFVSTCQENRHLYSKGMKQSTKNVHPSNMSTQCWFNNSHHDIENNSPYRNEFAIHWYDDKLDLKQLASEQKPCDDSQIEHSEMNLGFHFFTIVRQIFIIRMFGWSYLLTKH